MTTREFAEKYVRAQLAIMDGAVEKGIARIGLSEYERLIEEVAEVHENARQIIRFGRRRRMTPVDVFRGVNKIGTIEIPLRCGAKVGEISEKP